MDYSEIINNLTVNDYIEAFKNIEKTLSGNDKKMLQINYESPNFTITATRLAQKMNFANFNAANLRYGSLAGRLCDYFKVKPKYNLEILVYFSKINNEWHWTLKENVIKAIRELRWFYNENASDVINEVDQFKIQKNNLSQTEREAIIQSRVGQGLFRSNLIRYWQGCSVTGYQNIDILRASHIKPWRYSTNEERLDFFNGLLLLPNLDILFDLGFISFTNDGNILISSNLNPDEYKILGISSTMKLRKIEKGHIKFIEFHRNTIFKK